MNKIFYQDNKIFLPTIESNSIDLILTDFPYLISKNSNFNKGNDKYKSKTNDFGEWDKVQLDLNFYLSQFHRVLKRGGKAIIFYDIWKLGDIKRIAEELKFSQPRIGIWNKTNPMPINSKSNYLSNSKEYFISITRHGWVGRSRSKSTFNSEYDGGVYNHPTISGNEVLGHSTQKPESLFKDLILKHSNQGDLILDPFIGSGTTAKVCEDTDRNCIGIENDQESIDMCKNRKLIIY
jgi:site-specific DNA-methyltransferase (adenine-specific)